jgi:hypothetical protein
MERQIHKLNILNNNGIETSDSDTLLKLYELYDRHRDAVLWFLEEFDANTYDEYIQRYSGTSTGRSYFICVCGFFELSGVLIEHGMIEEDLYFDMFNPTPFWEKAEKTVRGMRNKRPHIYENFELLNKKRVNWREKKR